MIKTHLLLESEKNIRFIDERKYRERVLLEKCSTVYIHSTKKPLLKEQQIVLNSFFEYLLAKNTLSVRSIYLYIGHLHGISRVLPKPYSLITKEDLMKYVATLRSKSKDTIISKQNALRQFFTWLGKKDVVDWIKFAKRGRRELTPEGLLSREEIKKMIDVCTHERDKALLMMIYEGALRVSEATHIKIKDIAETEHGMTITVSGKTGQRNLLLIDSVSYIKSWLNKHEYRGEPEALLFYSFAKNEYGRILHVHSVLKLVKRCATISDINKHVFTHLLRHSRLDYLGRQGFRERDLKIFAGWTEGSDMANTYLHYDVEEVNKKLLALKGIRQEQEMTLDTTFNPVVCSSCNKQNTPTQMYCICGELLVQDKRAKADAIMNRLFEHKEFKALVEKLLQQEKEVKS